ncbi:MAG: T9SS type A sorting domain-containing protein, partial [Bacteroidia bacterium]|nr:T9SS type A sorting domain-containing protein [Bacteroidia bacterium]
EYELSDHNFKPTPIGGLGQGYQGDNIDLTSTDSTLWPVWMDNSTGIYQIWTSPVKFSVIQGMDDEPAVFDFRLFPNPTQGNLKFEIRNWESGEITMMLYDLTGTPMGIIFHEPVMSGILNGDLDLAKIYQGRGITPGIYFIRLTVNGHSTTKKLIYLE